MAAKVFNVATYSRLLSESHPRIPRSAEENETLIAQIQEIQNKKKPTPEELELMELMLTLVQSFEDQHYSIPKSTPDAALRELMRARGLEPKDLYAIFGSKGTTSEVLRGKRAISKNAARALAELFNVSVSLFM